MTRPTAAEAIEEKSTSHDFKRAIHSLPMGLTEKAIAAAPRIRFQSATINGRPVSVYVQLQHLLNATGHPELDLPHPFGQDIRKVSPSFTFYSQKRLNRTAQGGG